MMRPPMPAAVVAVLVATVVAAAGSPALAGGAMRRSMDTDRPNAANTPHTIEPGHFQVEAGALDFGHDRRHDAEGVVREDDTAFGDINVRVGVRGDLELNAAIAVYERDRIQGGASPSRVGGFGDTVVGGKWNAWGDDGSAAAWTTALAVQPQLKCPTASGELGNGHLEGSAAVPLLVNLPAAFHLGLQPGVSRQRNAANTAYVTGFAAALSVDRVVYGALDAYLEYAGEVTTAAHDETMGTLDIGGTRPLNDNVVVDAGVNLGLSGAAKDVEILLGISARR